MNPVPLSQTRQTTTPPPHRTSQTTVPPHSSKPTSSCPTPPPIMSTTGKSGLKANKPTEFMGSYTKSEEFLQECETYIELTESSASDRAKIAFILTYLKGPAPSAWKGSISSQLTIERTPSMSLNNASMWLMVIQTKSLTPSLSSSDFFQGKHPFEQYLADFLILQAETGLQDKSYLIRRLVTGLNE